MPENNNAGKGEGAQPPARGRPSLYTDELAAEIIERISVGEPLAKICRDEHMPAVRTVSDWKAARPEFSAAIAHARADGFDALAAECLEIADTPSSEPEEDLEPQGHGGSLRRRAAESGDVQRDRLRIETRLKLLSKWDPKRYGDRIAHVGGDPSDPPIRHSVDLSTLSDEELEQLERIRSKLGGPADAGRDPGGEGAP